MNNIVFHQVRSNQEKSIAASLIREYLEFLNLRIKRDYEIEFDLDAMVDSDVRDESKFHPPSGRFYLVTCNDKICGIGCLKKIDDGIAEIQRMYVTPESRGMGIGRAIANQLINDAKSVGYQRLKLESLRFLEAAHSLYRSLGFKEINPYADNSMKSFQAEDQLDTYYSITVFMEMTL
ncbi:MAG: GNAT family N-acetyltransferase [Pseudomonadota bacterium]